MMSNQRDSETPPSEPTPGAMAPDTSQTDSDSSLNSLFAGFIRHINNLQNSANRTLDNHRRTKREMESRESALSTTIDIMTRDCAQCVAATEQIQQRLKHTTESSLSLISEDLQDVRDTLTQRQDGLKKVMSELSLIGRQLSMLAMNAKIEATRAGESEAGFSVVADEVKHLARSAIEHHKRAAQMFDLSDVNDLMVRSVDHFQQSNERSADEIGSAFDEINESISHIDSSLSMVKEHHTIISEVTRVNLTAVEAASDRLKWSCQRADTAAGMFQETSDQQSLKSRLGKLLDSDGIQHSPDFDRYRDIKARGYIRVAIEPDFVGLSFRKSPGSALDGLDVEYSKALAAHLGVRCEFVEAPWDTLTELLHIGPRPDEAPADIVLSALPPRDGFDGVAYSETYTYLNWVLARKTGNEQIASLDTLQNKTLGIINDPGAFELLESVGVRWQSNRDLPGGKIFLEDLIAYSDQSRIHDCLAEGVVDAFGVDMPIYHWACSDPSSPWYGKIEICTGNISDVPYYYSVGVAAVPSSYTLLREINAFFKAFLPTARRAEIERKWQGGSIEHHGNYRLEAGNLIGEEELRHTWQAQLKQAA